MSVDKREKKRKKRQEKQKTKLQKAENQVRREKVEEYEWLAKQAYRAQEYQRALQYALKVLKIHPAHERMRRVAIACANIVNDAQTLARYLGDIYSEGSLYYRNEYLLLAKAAVSARNFFLAKDVLEDLVSDVTSKAGRLVGRFNKANLKEAQEFLLYARSMIEGSAAPRSQPKTAKVKPAQPATPVALVVQRDSVQKGDVAPAPDAKEAVPEKPPELKISIEIDPQPVLQAIQSQRKSDRVALDLALKAYGLSFRSSYDQLICLPTLRDVRSLWYQEETARKVMKTFRGRAILADEVGLGKTIEAGLILKEYMMRGLVRSALVLTPSSLVHQWQEELTGKFGIPFVSTNDALIKEDPDRFWRVPFVLASIHTAKSRRHFDGVTARSYDLVVVDEAHHLKNRTTLNWKLVNAIQKTFLLMLTATPVQNHLEELFNLVTLLRPGHLKTQKAFKEQFVTRGNPTDPRNRETLRRLLKEVMVRNTRSITQLHLPPRFATTVRIAQTPAEEDFYGEISRFVSARAGNGASRTSRFTLKRLLAAAGSSHVAALRMLERMGQTNGDAEGLGIAELLKLGRQIRLSGKAERVVELLRASKDQKILFVNHIATLEYIQGVLQEHGVSHTTYHGGMSTVQKQASMDAFRGGKHVLLATGTGGEGHNLQFCRVMLNYDLPWNPMEIEQRIGRIHRIGQEREVQVYNFCAAGSIEDRVLEILDRKINMFELVVGEIDMILGRLQGEEEFSDMVYEIWVKHADEAERQKAFDALAARLKRARSAYEKSRELDEKLFQEDFGV